MRKQACQADEGGKSLLVSVLVLRSAESPDRDRKA